MPSENLLITFLPEPVIILKIDSFPPASTFGISRFLPFQMLQTLQDLVPFLQLHRDSLLS